MGFFASLEIDILSESPLLQAIFAGNIKKLKAIVAANRVDIRGVTFRSPGHGLTPLMLASLSPNSKMPAEVLNLYPKSLQQEQLHRLRVDEVNRQENLFAIAAHSPNQEMIKAVLALYEPSDRGKVLYYKSQKGCNVVEMVGEYKDPKAVTALMHCYDARERHPLLFSRGHLRAKALAALEMAGIDFLSIINTRCEDSALSALLTENSAYLLKAAAFSGSVAMLHRVIAVCPHFTQSLFVTLSNFPEELVEFVTGDEPALLSALLQLFSLPQQRKLLHIPKMESSLLRDLIIRGLNKMADFILRNFSFTISQLYFYRDCALSHKNNHMVASLSYAIYLQVQNASSLQRLYWEFSWLHEKHWAEPPPQVQKVIYHWKLFGEDSYSQYQMKKANVDFFTQRLREGENEAILEGQASDLDKRNCLQLARMRMAEMTPIDLQSCAVEPNEEVLHYLFRQSQLPRTRFSEETLKQNDKPEPSFLHYILKQSQCAGPYQYIDKIIILRYLMKGFYSANDEVTESKHFWERYSGPNEIQIEVAFLTPLSGKREKRTWVLIAILALELGDFAIYASYVEKLLLLGNEIDALNTKKQSELLLKLYQDVLGNTKQIGQKAAQNDVVIEIRVFPKALLPYLSLSCQRVLQNASKQRSLIVIQKLMSFYPELKSHFLACTLNEPSLLIEACQGDEPSFLAAFIGLFTAQDQHKLMHTLPLKDSLLAQAAFRGFMRTVDFIMRHFSFQPAFLMDCATYADKKGQHFYQDEITQQKIYEIYTWLYAVADLQQKRVVETRSACKNVVYHWRFLNAQTYQQCQIAQGNVDFVTDRLKEGENEAKIERDAVELNQLFCLDLAKTRLNTLSPRLVIRKSNERDFFQQLLAQSRCDGPYQKIDKKLIMGYLLDGKYCAKDLSEGQEIKIQVADGALDEVRQIRTWVLIALYAIEMGELKIFVDYFEKAWAQGKSLQSLLSQEQLETLMSFYLNRKHNQPTLKLIEDSASLSPSIVFHQEHFPVDIGALSLRDRKVQDGESVSLKKCRSPGCP